MACALAMPGISYSSWALPGGLVAAPVAHTYAAPLASTLHAAPLVATGPAIATYSALSQHTAPLGPPSTPWAVPVAAPAEAVAKSEDSTSTVAAAPAGPTSDDAIAVEAAPADSPAQSEYPAPTVAPTPAPAEEAPAPEAAAPAPESPVAPVASLALPVPEWTSSVVPAPLLAAAAAVTVAAPFTKSPYHAQDELGNSAYEHAEPGSVHTAVQDAAGNRVGSFSYLNPSDGQVHKTDYVADSLCYRVAANDLPVEPAAPVAETAEVDAARAANLAAHSRARRSAATTPASTSPLAALVVAQIAAPWAYAAPLVVSHVTPVVAAPYAAHLGLPATLTTVVNTQDMLFLTGSTEFYRLK